MAINAKGWVRWSESPFFILKAVADSRSHFPGARGSLIPSQNLPVPIPYPTNRAVRRGRGVPAYDILSINSGSHLVRHNLPGDSCVGLPGNRDNSVAHRVLKFAPAPGRAPIDHLNRKGRSYDPRFSSANHSVEWTYNR